MQARLPPQLNMIALVRRVQPQASELDSASNHRLAVRMRLLSSFDVSRIVSIGSHARGTAIRWYSDLDMMAVLRRNEAKWGKSIVSSSTLLGRVVADLKARFPHTVIRGDQQAVIVRFSAGQQNLDVVPAMWKRFTQARPVYIIPDANGEWLETSPEAHQRFFRVADGRSAGKLRRVAQLLRWWKFSRTHPLPLSSFHADMLLADSGICQGAKTYGHCLYGAFRLLARRECRPLRDPVGLAGVIPAAKTFAQTNLLNDGVRYALQHSEAALSAEAVGDHRTANMQWNLVFNGSF